MALVLEISDLRTYIYQRRSVVHAVDGVSLTVEAGESVGVVGESGCGKSTTGLSILRLLPPGGRILAGSSIKVQGTEVTTLPERELLKLRGGAVGMIFQDPMSSLNPTMTIGKQIAEAVRQHRDVTRRAASTRALEVLGLVGVPQPRERIGYYPHQLSGGLRQRVMIAMALACEPVLLIADEPTTALDVTIQDEILTLLDRLKAELGMGLLLITHDLGVIAGRADRTVVMYAGRVVEEGVTADVFGRMRHPYTKALISSIPQEAATQRRVLFTIPGAPPDLSTPAAGCPFQPRCQFATEICGSQPPPMSQDVPGHRYACFHPVDSRERDAVDVGRIAVIGEPADGRAEIDGEAPLLRVVNVVKEYAAGRGMFQRGGGTVKAVSDVSFAVGAGETLGLVGESGCGKTTLAQLLAALEKPSGGEIYLGDEDVGALFGWQPRQTETQRRVRRAVQLMFQDPYSSLDPRMRVGSILREPLAVQHVGKRREQNERIASLLHEVGLRQGSEELYPHEFSGGQRQRIGLARALILDPKLLIADEPVSALDVSIRSQILNLMCTLQDRHRLTYILISHDLSVIRHMADRIAVMYLGKLVEIGPGPAVYRQPVHHYTAGLIAAVPNVGGHDRSGCHQIAIKGELPSAIEPPSGCRFRTRCAFAEELCAEMEPPMVRFGDGHYAACHFPRRQAMPEAAPIVVALPDTA